MLTGSFACFHVQSFDHLRNQKAGAFVEADHRILRVKRLRIEIKNIFHARDKTGVHFSYTPGLLQMWLQFVFFRTCRTLVCDRFSQIPSSTALSASSRSVHLACPSGGVEHASAVIFARLLPSMLI